MTRDRAQWVIEGENELARLLKNLEKIFGFSGQLDVVWMPGHSKKNEHNATLHGEVKQGLKGGIIMVYTQRLENARFVLIHEFVENFIVDELIEPWNDLVESLMDTSYHDIHQKDDPMDSTKVLMRAFYRTSYTRREKIINILTRFIWEKVNGRGEHA